MREAPNQQRSLTTGSSGRRYRTAAEPERSLHRKVVVVIDGVMVANLRLA
jgi:hypothetical protein